MAAIGTGWIDGAWVEAAWVTGGSPAWEGGTGAPAVFRISRTTHPSFHKRWVRRRSIGFLKRGRWR